MRCNQASFLIISLVSITVFACVVCDTDSFKSDVPVSKPNEGLSTASDTLKKEEEAISLDGLSVEQLKQARQNVEKHKFEAEVDRMMKLIVNSLYKNKEIFLRELISNASDALDKLRVLSLTDKEVLDATEDMTIRIKADKETRTLHIIDTGIGMSMQELSDNLGTIAKSGTSEFLAKIAESQSSSETKDLIGQFGVGFYSSFLVANRVMVVSKSNTDDQYIWESDSGSFSVYKDPRGNTLKRGTEVVLYLTDEAEDFLQHSTLKELVKKYSQFITFPIYVWASRTESVQVEPEEKYEPKESADADASVEEEKKSEPKTVEKVVWDWERINENKPVWKRKPDEVTEKEYNELYRAHSKDHDDPLTKIHFHAEGEVSFSSVLYIPKRSPANIFQMHSSHSDRIKLYVRRVFISDVAEEMMPKYLAFIFGIVDSDELPLNVSREMLQQNKLLKMIKKKLVRKVIDVISKLSDDKFKEFWREFSVNIKLGIVDDHSNRSKLSKLLRFRTSKSGDEQISLDDYVSRMKEGQENIYYLTGATMEEVQSSPLSERMIRKGFEVLYMTDPLDEYMLQSLTEYDKKKLQNIAKEGIELDKSEEAKSRKETQQKEFEPLMKWLKEDVLKDLIEKAELSERLSDSPCALIASQYGWSGNMERIMRAQAYQRGDDPSSSYYSQMKKIFEVNPRHPLIKELNARIKVDKNDQNAKETANLLFDLATLRSGYTLKNPVSFAQRIEAVMRKNLDVSLDEKPDVEPENVQSSDDKVTPTDEETEEKSPTNQKSQEQLNTTIKDDQHADAKDEL